jgi:phosphoglycolate phosphatase
MSDWTDWADLGRTSLHGGKHIVLSPRLFLFDIDGTILRGGTAVHRDAFAHVFRTVYGVPLSLDTVVAAGRTDTWLLVEPLRRWGMRDEEIWAHMPQAFAVMEAYVEEHITDLRGSVLPGVPEVLARLAEQGYLLGLLTGNLASIAYAKMRQAGLAHYFFTGGFGEESLDRADLVPVALAHAVATFGLPLTAGDAVIVGDTPLDVVAGQAHGALTCGVATGRFSTDTLRATGADLVLESLTDYERAVAALAKVGREL